MRLVERDLADAQVSGLSTDRRFVTAYNAALQLATIVLRASGYRASGPGHHWTTIQVLPEIMGESERPRADYLDSCRRKRNIADYDIAGRVSESEVEEIIDEILRFRDDVVRWLRKNDPGLPAGKQ
jgi:hypothetical protein